jgi:hypothetical protein
MTHYRDLALCRYGDGALNADAWQVPLRAIGWLGFPFPYRLGRVPPGFRSRLDALVGGAERHSYGCHYYGFHICSWCVVTQRIPPEQPWSQSSLWVPGNGVVYVAPIGIPHYVAAHGYRPPTEFIEAVMRCPEYGSTAYEAALTEANGGVVPPLLVRRWAAVVRESAGGVSMEECQSAWLAIKDYLAQHPEAEDTADGVERCWLAGSASRPAVERALASLVRRRELQVLVGPDGSEVYSAVPRQGLRG